MFKHYIVQVWTVEALASDEGKAEQVFENIDAATPDEAGQKVLRSNPAFAAR